MTSVVGGDRECSTCSTAALSHGIVEVARTQEINDLLQEFWAQCAAYTTIRKFHKLIVSLQAPRKKKRFIPGPTVASRQMHTLSKDVPARSRASMFTSAMSFTNTATLRPWRFVSMCVNRVVFTDPNQPEMVRHGMIFLAPEPAGGGDGKEAMTQTCDVGTDWKHVHKKNADRFGQLDELRSAVLSTATGSES